MPENIQNYRILGVRVSALTRDEWLSLVELSIQNRSRYSLVSQNLHSAFLNQREPELVRLQANASAVRIDGMPLILIGRLLGLPLFRRHRAGFMDLLPHLIAKAEKEGWTISYVGGKPGVAERARDRLLVDFPDLRLFVENGYFDNSKGSTEVADLADRVNKIQPDILLIGMGMPRQEQFLLRHRQLFDVGVFLTCGAAFDYVAREVPMAPRWLSAIGMEWLFRLFVEPSRLWKRYLIEPLYLLRPLANDFRRRVRGSTLSFRMSPEELWHRADEPRQ